MREIYKVTVSCFVDGGGTEHEALVSSLPNRMGRGTSHKTDHVGPEPALVLICWGTFETSQRRLQVGSFHRHLPLQKFDRHVHLWIACVDVIPEC